MNFYVLDRLLNKPIKIYSNHDIKSQYGDKIIYIDDENGKSLVGTYLGYESETQKTGKFHKILEGSELANFQKMQDHAKELFKLFKEDFGSRFPNSVPITARMDILGETVYFYFYSEDRFNFVDFLKEFRQKINYKFFLFQVGARERIRMYEGADCIYGTCGQLLCCKKNRCPLPTVDSDNITIQNLENRGIEKVKGRCGKLKCCLNYERDLYLNEEKKYPKKGEEFEYNNQKFTCSSFNIMTGEIVAKSVEENENLKINIKDLKKI